VAEGSGMTALAQHVEDYLAIRQSLGFKLRTEGRLLADFAAFTEGIGRSTVTVDAALQWATMPTGVGHAYLSQRMRAVRGFARYLHGIDPATEIPPLELLPARRHRPTPHIYTEREIAALMAAAGTLRPALRAATVCVRLLPPRWPWIGGRFGPAQGDDLNCGVGYILSDVNQGVFHGCDRVLDRVLGVVEPTHPFGDQVTEWHGAQGGFLHGKRLRLERFELVGDRVAKDQQRRLGAQKPLLGSRYGGDVGVALAHGVGVAEPHHAEVAQHEARRRRLHRANFPRRRRPPAQARWLTPMGRASPAIRKAT
jgi:hypothetical protein